MRNPNGYGSVFKLSGKNRRKPYGVKKTLGFDDNGYPMSKIIGYYEKRKDAMQALAEYNANPYDLTKLNSTIQDVYRTFEERKKDKVSSSALYAYQAAYGHLKPLYNIPMREIKTYQMQEVIDNLDRKWQTKSHIQTLLTQLFDIAIEMDVCQKNYAKFISLESKPKSDIHKPFTDEEIKILFENINVPFVDTILIMIYSGMRPSELLSMKQENIDIEKRIMIGGIKTKAGKNRHIPINKKIIPFLENRLNEQTYLVPGAKAGLSYVSYKKFFYKTMAELGMQHLTHDCRHTFATLIGRTDADKLTVKRIMGHATQDITDNIYTHKNDEDLLKAIDLI